MSCLTTLGVEMQAVEVDAQRHQHTQADLDHHHHHHHRHFYSDLNSENYRKDHCSGGEVMTRKKKCNSESNSFIAAAEQVCLQSVLEHRQQRGRRNIAWQAIPHFDSV